LQVAKIQEANMQRLLKMAALVGAVALSYSAYAEGEAGMKAEYLGPFHSYVASKAHPSFAFTSPVVVGAVLPAEGVVYYEVPADYGVPQYRYTVVNNQTVLVDPGTRKIIQIVP
jgi:hypothetical protein